MKTIVLVDSSKVVQYKRVGKTILNCLEHFGIWYEIIDLNWAGISYEEIHNNVSVIILGQEGISSSISDTDFSLILKSVENGTGLVIFDGYLNKYSEKFLKTIGIENFSSKKTQTVSLEKNWITEISPDVVYLKRDTLHYCPSVKSDWDIFMKNEQGNGCGFFRKYGKGKIIFWTTLPSIFLDEYLGHTEGLDGVFFRSIIWTSKKPFITKTMPPFVTGRIDDASGSGSPVSKYPETVNGLKYLDILNKYKFIPNIGLFIDDLKEEDDKKIREKHYDGLAEFSPHAFSDPENKNEFPIYLKHSGEEFSDSELKENFEKVDIKFGKIGINISKTLNAHFGEVGLKTFPFLKERGVKYFMNSIRVGKRWDDPLSKIWEIKPYNKPFFSLGYIPEDEYFFNVEASPPKIDISASALDSESPDFDFLYGCTTFWNENKKVEVEKAAKRGIFKIQRGLENGFFGSLSTHEQRISNVPILQFENIISSISNEINKMSVIFKSYDFISQYAESRANYTIDKIEITNKISIVLKGENKVEQLLYLFTETNGLPKTSFLKVPTFQKQIILNFSI
ncbi:MAG TPA: hypothetical protein PLW95_03895 [bacterium]|nr:hypothetical protein [bacterium]